MKRFLAYIIILIIISGFFLLTSAARAQNFNDLNTSVECVLPDSTRKEMTLGECIKATNNTGLVTNPLIPIGEGQPIDPNKLDKKNTTGLQNNLPACTWTDWSVPGCMAHIFFIIFITVPGILLTVSGSLFDALVAICLDSEMLAGSTFIPSAWAVIRDLSNMFFILVLLYIAIKMILGLGGAEAQKMIARVVVVALVINFSLFFSKVIIDSSNILALIFYNKLDVKIDKDGKPIEHLPITKLTNEKSISAAFATAFNPSALLSDKFFEDAKKRTAVVSGKELTEIVGRTFGFGGPAYALYGLYGAIKGYVVPTYEVPTHLVLSIMVISGIIMLFAAYTFLIAGFAFLSRLIELWILIIFSPFAFMSSTIPELEKVEYIGWNAWIKRLLEVSFMAPIFMLFMFLIFKIINADMFGNLIQDKNNQTTLQTILFVVIPALVVLILLQRATKFAKEGSGQLGEAVISGAKMVGGLALGAATGGAALLGTKVIGGAALAATRSSALKTMATSEEGGAKKYLARGGLSLANSLAGRSFDFRQSALGKFASSKSGLKLNQGGLSLLGLSEEKLKGGIKEREKKRAEKIEETYKSYYLSPAEKEVQDLRHAQYKKDFEEAEKAFGGFKDIEKKEFEKAYREGDNKTLHELGMDKKKTTGAGDIESAEDLNKARKNKYLNSLAELSDAEKGLAGAFKRLATGVAKAAPVGVGAAALGLGAAAPLVFIPALIKALDVGKANRDKEVIAMARGGVKKKAEDILHHAAVEAGLIKDTHGHGEEEEDHDSHKAKPVAHKEEKHTETKEEKGSGDAHAHDHPHG